MTGVRVTDEDGEQELRAPLVVGADGRRSMVARLVGADRPHRLNANGRACFFAYFEDARPDWRGVAAQWREGAELGTAFPCDGGLMLVLLMPPVDALGRPAPIRRATSSARSRDPGPRRTPAGLPPAGQGAAAIDLPSYFRRSAGPGGRWPGTPGTSRTP